MDSLPTDCQWNEPDDRSIPEYMPGYHIEEYTGNHAKVAGRLRLQPESTAALLREIARTPEPPAPRQPRGQLMEQRLAKARRDVLRRIGNIA